LTKWENKKEDILDVLFYEMGSEVRIQPHLMNKRQIQDRESLQLYSTGSGVAEAIISD